MTRDEFMKELAYLLQDIQDEDKDDAVQYYTDYFEEAGPDKEAEVIQELGSPERIAAMIRADIAGHLESGGEFTEQGYQTPAMPWQSALTCRKSRRAAVRETTAGDRTLTGNTVLTRSRALTMDPGRLIPGEMALPRHLRPGPAG